MNRPTKKPTVFSKVSVKSQTVIPREVREQLGLQPGDTLRYRLTASPIPGSICCCVDCRRASAAPMVAWVAVRRENFILLSGELKRIRHAERLRSFAPCCGTPILVQDAEDSEWIDVTTCSLDQPELYAPKAVIWTEDRLPWMANAASLPEFLHDREAL